MKPSEVLRQATDNFVSGKLKWMTGWYARDNVGRKAHPHSYGIVACCTIGAIGYLKQTDGHTVSKSNEMAYVRRAIEALYPAFGGLMTSVPEWNDSLDRTKQQVIAVFEAATRLAESEGK